MIEKKTALVIGATGVTGTPLVQYLTELDTYSKVTVFTRRPIEFQHHKITNHVVNFDNIGEWQDLLSGDDLFSAMGTTLKLAGSKKAQYKVDYHYQANTALAASNNGVKRLFLVSAPNAKAKSAIFYNRMKGELEDYVATLNFNSVIYFRPSIIQGNRMDKRLGEQIGFSVLDKATTLLPFLATYRPISGGNLANAIANSSTLNFKPGLHDYELGEIFSLI